MSTSLDRKSSVLKKCLSVLAVLTAQQLARGQTTPQINGIGLTQYSTQNGIYGASLNGGTEVFIYGQGLSMYPSQNMVSFTQSGTSVAVPGPGLSNDNEFSSNIGLGILQYTLPAVSTLYGITIDQLNAYDSIAYQLSVKGPDMSGTINNLQCTTPGNCNIVFSRAYTPVVFAISPQVVYFGSSIAIIVDPKRAPSYKKPGDWPFTEARIDNHTIDFQVLVNGDSVLNYDTKSQVLGRVGDQNPSESSSFRMKFPAGYSLQQSSVLTTCKYDKSACHQVQTVASIDSITAEAGYTTGGQTVVITGNGFTSGNIKIMLDGVLCTVLSYSRTQVKCMTNARSSASTNNTNTVGQHGLRRRIYNNTAQTPFGIAALTSFPHAELLATQLESAQNNGSYYGNAYSGWFKAPATTNYKFYVTCDDQCQVTLGSTNLSTSTGSIILENPGVSGFRQYWRLGGAQNSSWIPLVKDNYYSLKALHVQGGGAEHISVGVEIQQTAIANHPNAVKQIQRILTNSTITRDILTYQVLKPNRYGSLLWAMSVFTYHPTTGQRILVQTRLQPPFNATQQEMVELFQPFYTNHCEGGCNVIIKKTATDINGALTDDIDQTDKIVYLIGPDKACVNKSHDIISFARYNTSAVPTTIPTWGSKPLAGNFRIQCFRLDGSSNTTADIPYNANCDSIARAIGIACTEYRDNVEVWDTNPNLRYEDGRDLRIRFSGVNGNVPQFKMINGTVPLRGLPNQAFHAFTEVQASSNIFYGPIPFDLLYTNETMPQAIVTVDNLPAVCAGLHCSYSYIPPYASIQSFSIVTSVLTVTGTNLPVGVTELTYSNVPCAISSNTGSQILCSISPMAVSGIWHPVVKDSFGIIPVDGSTTTATLGVTVTSISPSTGLNPAGHNMLTIVGKNFPLSVNDGNSLSVTFSDGSKCDVASSTSTQITCVTNAFNPAFVSAPLTVTVNINGQSDSSQTVSASNAPAGITSLTPNTASPVLKTNLTLKVSNTFAGTLSIQDLLVQFVSEQDPTYSKYANVIDVDNTLKTITVKFGGAHSGTYKLLVRSTANGAFDTGGIILTTVGKVTSFSPNSGSIYGGQLITITGFTFSNEVTDNPVQIGGLDCEVLSSSSTKIICRTPLRPVPSHKTETMLTFLSTSEEAVCAVPVSAGGCSYTWSSDNLPLLTTYSAAFDPVSAQHVLSFSGSGFNGDATSVQVFLDGQSLTVSSVSASTVTATISNIQGISSKNVQIYFPQGTPSGYQQLEAGITLAPALVRITPNVGSAAGSIITATVSGVGQGLAGALKLVTSTGVSICSSIRIVSYSQIQCKTNAAAIASGTAISFQVGTTLYTCASSDPTLCQYETSLSMPAVTGAVVSADYTQIQLSGTNFLTTGFSANVSYAGILADSVTIVSTTSAVATYTLGVPASATAIQSSLVFVSQTSATAHWASNTAQVSNPYIPSNSASTVTCSFAGGCLLTVLGRGLASNLKNANSATVTVCNQVCQLSAADSAATQASCVIPALATAYSINQFNITSPQDITQQGTFFSSNSGQTLSLFDGNNLNGWRDDTANSFAGIQYPQGFVGILQQLKFYMNAFTPSDYVANLQFQGSQDGTTYTTILTAGVEIHTGWNYYNFKHDASQPKYRYYRLFAQAKGGLKIGEVVVIGQIANADSNPNYSCTAQLTLNGVVSSLPTTVGYTTASTALLKTITPRFGTVKGGTSVTFTGTNFVTDLTKYAIKLDKIACTPTAATTTSVTCTTGKRPGLVPDSSLSIIISGRGEVASQGLKYIYVNLWSDTTTWGGEFWPMEGESVWIPAGLNLLVDIDATPVLNAVLVEGSLIFAPDTLNANHQRTFDASYVFVNGGSLEIGTEQFPYTSKLTITMHGNKETPEIPIYGNKVIGVRNGILDMHGPARTPVWTELASTANSGDLTITMNTAVDWKAGEKIVIAPTSYSHLEAEQRTIVSVDNANPNSPVITLDVKLKYQHYAAVETYGSKSISMRAEVGLLTRNVLFRGDPSTSQNNKYGAHIMLHSMGDESVIGRIENIELYDVGQAFQLGRYPIHFHMIGTVHKSYIKGNSIHRTYNRAVTFHGVHYLRVINNVAYDVMGHTFFVEDAIETNNILDGNLAILTKKSWSLLNTDQTPASFWITNPYNILRNNRAAGSGEHGFWFDLQENPTGPSYDPTICPDHMPLGEFSNNVGHSNGRYGLWLFHKHIPSTYPCSPIVYDAKNTTDPYWQNPLMTADYTGFTAYKNGECGIMLEEIGDVKVTNSFTADHVVAGIEISVVSGVRGGRAKVDGALVIGHSGNSDPTTMNEGSWGVITTRSEYLSVHNVAFYNFDQSGMAALGSCSHCFHSASTDSGARTVEFSGLSFDAATVLKKIRYQYPYRAIYYDIDGSLTGLGPKTWATPYWKHNVQPECAVKMDEFSGIVCNNQVEVRRLAFHNYQPDAFRGKEIRIQQWDDSLIGGFNTTTLEAYKQNISTYSMLPFKQLQNPGNAWAVPFVTNHKYRLQWAHGLDFTKMQCDLSAMWLPSDHNLDFVVNFTDTRTRVNFTTGGVVQANETLKSKANHLLETGDNIVYNDTATREFHFVVNGRNSSKKTLTITGERCSGSCFAGIGEDVAVEADVRYWSDVNSWPTKQLPIAGEDVVINATWNMVLDLPITPILNYLEINGRLTFLRGMDITLQSKIIFVRAGELSIGNATEPFDKQATILLHGNQSSQTAAYSNNIDTGNKVLANTGRINFYGVPRPNRMTRLLRTANAGDTQITVETGLDWVTGEKIGLAPTAISFNESDYGVIVTYDSTTGVLVLDRPLESTHWGAAKSTAPDYSGVDMRGEVVLLTRNVKIQGVDTQRWGCQFITSDFLEADNVQRAGRTSLDNVEMHNCSQYDNQKAALRFENTQLGYSSVTNCVLHHGYGWAINANFAANVLLKDNTVFSFVQFGVLVQWSSNVTLDGNVVIDVAATSSSAKDGFVLKAGGLVLCSYEANEICFDVKATNNLVAGTVFYGFAAPGHTCGDYASSAFINNVAHSIRGPGAHIFADPGNGNSKSCMEGSYFAAYKCTEDGVVTLASTDSVIFSNMVLIDNGWGASIGVGKEGDKLSALFKNSAVYGETEARDCAVQNQCTTGTFKGHFCLKKYGFMLPNFIQQPKPVFPKTASSLPIHHVGMDASWGGNTQVQNVVFSNFRSRSTYCGSSQSVFGIEGGAADYIVPTFLSRTKFVNVDQSTVAYLFDPPQAWANIDDCGEFPCTGPLNTFLSFESTTFSGEVRPDNTSPNFQILPHNPTALSGFSTQCTYQKDWNAYYCNSDSAGVLLFESLDEDKYDRTFSPMRISNAKTNFLSVLNIFMDVTWDGFYTGQKRLARFPSIIRTGSPGVALYNISYTGTAPNKQRFKMLATTGSITARIDYTKSGTWSVSDEAGNLITQNGWDDSIRAPAVIKGTKCGENRFLGVVNVLEFVLQPGCTLLINPVDSIQAKIRLQWDLASFYADGGSTKFVARFAAALGIAASDIKIVNVYQGSVFVQYAITSVAKNSATVLAALKAKITTMIQTNSFGALLGAPVMEGSFDGGQIILPTDGTSKTTDINGNNANGGGSTTTKTATSTGGSSKSGQDAAGSNSEGGLSDSAKLAIIVSLIVVFVGVALLVGILVYKRHKLDQQSPGKSNTAIQAIPASADEEDYEPQYHPKAELGNIFGGDDTDKQKRKVNQADTVHADSDEDRTVDHHIAVQSRTEDSLIVHTKLVTENEGEMLRSSSNSPSPLDGLTKSKKSPAGKRTPGNAMNLQSFSGDDNDQDAQRAKKPSSNRGKY